MKLVGLVLFLGGIALAVSWPSDASGIAALFVVAAGIIFYEAGSARPDPWDDLGRGRVGL